MRKLIYAGKYNGEEEMLPHREHPKGYVAFREPDLDKLVIFSNIAGTVLMLILVILVLIRGYRFFHPNLLTWVFMCLGPYLTFFPHEYLHSLCFKDTVYLYNYLTKGAFFVIGTEDMSRLRFVLLSLLPNLIFGVLPVITAILYPKLVYLGIFGAICTGMGFGDYFNVYTYLTQVPKGAMVYLSGEHSYWYCPDSSHLES